MFSNWITGEIFRVFNEENSAFRAERINMKNFLALVGYTVSDKISVTAAKTIFRETVFEGKDTDTLINEKGLLQISDNSVINEKVLEVIRENPDIVQKYLEGKTQVAGFLVGQVMKKMRGKGNPGMITGELRKELEKM